MWEQNRFQVKIQRHRQADSQTVDGAETAREGRGKGGVREEEKEECGWDL